MSDAAKPGLAAAAAVAIAAQAEAETMAAAGTDLLGDPVAPARGPGRPAGARNKATLEALDLIKVYGVSPLEYLFRLFTDPMQSAKRRDAAAIAALPYVHRKQPVAVDLGGTAVTIVLPGVTPDELADGEAALTLEGDFEISETQEKSKG